MAEREVVSHHLTFPGRCAALAGFAGTAPTAATAYTSLKATKRLLHCQRTYLKK